MMLAIDTETTGKDLWHGARPFFVTTCTEDGEQQWWEWDVCPLTRRVLMPEEDAREIRELVACHDELILQNAKFDAIALRLAGILELDWSRVHDTLRAGHLLASNQPHDLTSMTTFWVGMDISEHEKRLKHACLEARRLVKGRFPHWRIAKEGLPEMPSAKGESKEVAETGVPRSSPWAFDSWLPRAVAKELKYPRPVEGCKHVWSGCGWLCSRCKGHRWWTVLAEYSNADSMATMLLRKAQRQEIERRGMQKVYEEVRKWGKVSCKLESNGVTVNGKEQAKMIEEYAGISRRSADTCLAIAKERGCDLQLPKSGNNKSLLSFCFDTLSLPVVKQGDSGAPSLDAEVIEHYQDVLKGKPLEFVNALAAKRKCDTAVTYMRGYEKYWFPLEKGADHAEDHRRPGDGSKQGLLHRRGGSALDRRHGGDDSGLEATQVGRKGFPGGRGPDERPGIMGRGCGRSVAGIAIAGQGALVRDQAVKDRSSSSEEAWHILHPGNNPTGTDTLRWSFSNPNEANVSKKEGSNLRRCFGPTPGREWWSLDAQNIELRIPTFEAVEEEVMDVFLRPNDPPYYGSYHLVVFDTLHPELFRKHGKEVKTLFEATWYQWIKNGNFAVQYGAQDATADRSYHVPGARRMLASRFTKIAQLNQQYINFASKHGYVETIPDKEVDPERGYPLLCTRTEWGRIMPTVPFCYHVSGTAMWWMGKAMVRVQNQLDEWERDSGFDGFITLQVHDELVLDFPKGRGEEPWRTNLPKIRKVQRLMESCGDGIGVPTPVSVEYHATSWDVGRTL